VNLMQTSNRILDDLARVANGAVSTLTGVKGEIDAMVRQRIERLLVDADLVPRDEFEAVKAMAAEARAEQDRLAKRVAALEAQLTKAPAKPKSAAAKTPRAKAAPKSAPKTTAKPAGKAPAKPAAKS
jgi:BMFP domain-containing protein YqiC